MLSRHGGEMPDMNVYAFALLVWLDRVPAWVEVRCVQEPPWFLRQPKSWPARPKASPT